MAPTSALTEYKLVCLGDQLVGKTSIITQFMYDKFDDRYEATAGIDFLSKSINLGDRTVKLQIWDTSGQERFRSIIPSYIRESSVAVIVFDVASRQSFLNTSKWVEDVRTELGTDVIIVLVGNKTDLVDKREVSIEEGEGKAQDLDVMFMETSAKAGFDVKALFLKIADGLPGTENISSAKQDDKVNVNFKSSSANPDQSQSQGIPLSATKSKNKQKQATTRIAMAPLSAINKYKLVWLGDQWVGKTSIITRFMYDKFDDKYQATIGIEFLSKSINLGDRTVGLQIWDTAGHERFKSLIPSYIRESSVAVIVFDVACRQSFLNTSKWVEDVRTELGIDVIIVLVGNKTDLVDKREVSIGEGEAKAQELDVMFMETSAKAGFDVKALFLKIADGLPGTENVSSAKQDDTVDAKLKSSSENPDQSQSQGSG